MPDLTREDVARLRAYVAVRESMRSVCVDPDVIQECLTAGGSVALTLTDLRALLALAEAVEGAPEGVVDYSDDDHAIEVNMGRFLNADEHALVGQTVRLVRVQGVG